VEELIDDPFQHQIQSALGQWRAIVDGSPRIARERVGWHVDGAQPAAQATAGSGS
jgi:hypothetical protein